MSITKEKKKAIWLIAGGNMQIPIAKNIKSKGYKLILTDKSSHCPCRQYADEFLEIDTFDIIGNINATTMLKQKYDIKSVFTAGADCHLTVSALAKKLGLAGVSTKISRICRYKYFTRKYLSEAGIYQPRFIKIRTLKELRNNIDYTGLPAILKSSDNSGSRGLIKLSSYKDLTAENLKVSITSGTTGYAILEELLKPVKNEISELSVETLWQDGKMYWLNWVDRLFREDFKKFNLPSELYKEIGWGVEIGHINPATHSYGLKQVLEALIYKAGIAIGMDNQQYPAILKADIMLTDKGPCILELTPRLSGGWDSSKTTYIRKANFIGGALELSLGTKLDLDIWYNFFTFKNPQLFSAIVSKPEYRAKDCIGRLFAEGHDFVREKAVQKALNNLREGNYVVE